MSSKTRTAAIVVVIVAFIAGILVGVAGDHLYLMRNPRHPRFSADRMADRLAGQLDLSAQQKTQVRQIIERHRAKIDATMNAVRPQVRSEIDATNAEIDAVLTPDQRTKFAAIRMKMGSHHRDRNGATAR